MQSTVGNIPPTDRDSEPETCPITPAAAPAGDSVLAGRFRERCELDALKSGTTALLVHEVRGSLCVLAGFLDMAAEDLEGRLDPATREILESALQQMERTTGLLQQLGDFAQTWPPSAGRDRGRVEEMLDDLLPSLAVQLGSRFPDVVLEIEPAAGEVFVNAGIAGLGLRSVIGSLVRLESGPSQIVLCARRSGDRLTLEVHDPRLDLDDRTLDGFARAASAAEPGAGSVALGQWIAWRAAALLGGELVVRGEPGDGVRVILSLPLAGR